MKITLIRHGKPEYELKGTAKAKEISRVVKSYDLSGIKDKPTHHIIENLSNSTIVVCSDLKRSIESAKALGFSNIHYSESLYREVAIPHFKSGEFSMKLYNWGVFLRLLSIFGFSRNGESLAMARRRASHAASALVDIAKDKKSVLFVGHGFINYFIAKELLKKKWQGPARPSNGYWDYATYRYHE
jgi:broad specificity phosphatase PhoE